MGRALLLLVALAASIVALPSVAADAAAGELGAPLAESTFVGAVTAGPDGNIWFSAESYGYERSRVVGKVTPGGKITEYTAADGADSITTGADGNVWFTEADAIGRITPGGDVTSFDLAAGAGAPRALTAGPDGDIWFVIEEPAAVGRISPSGSVTTFPLSGEGQPSAITTGPAGDLWFTEPKAGRIGRITAAGEESEFPLPDASARPNSIALGPDGNLWFSDGSQPRVGRITPAGEVTFFPVPTIESTDEVVAGPGGRIWFTAGNEIGTISTAGKITWPTCFSRSCQYPPAAMTTGPDGRLWVASGMGHCPSYCGGGSEQSYIFGSSNIGRFALPPVTVGIGPRLAPLRHGRTSIIVGCGDRAACSGTLRLRALVKPPGRRFFARLISKVTYSLAAGEIQKVALRLPLARWNKLLYGRGFLIVDATQGGLRVAKRGFYFSPKEGGTAKHF
jgi:streptogramin lyase